MTSSIEVPNIPSAPERTQHGNADIIIAFLLCGLLLLAAESLGKWWARHKANKPSAQVIAFRALEDIHTGRGA
jgi:hypothetical protein